MGKLYLILFLLSFFGVNAQTKLTFSYDTAGNQTNRILCINCLSKSVQHVKEIEEVVENDLEKFFPEDVISYYPNPVKEQLYLQWQLAQDNYVTSVQVYSLTGQALQSYQGNSSLNNLNIPFQQYPTGISSIAFLQKWRRKNY